MPDESGPTSLPDRGDLPVWFKRFARFSWGFLGMVGAAAVVVLGLAWLQDLFIPLILAAFFAVVFAPGVDWLDARRVPRSIGSLLIIAAITVAIGAASFVVVVGLTDQADELVDRFDEAKLEVQDLVQESKLRDVVETVRDNAGESGPTIRDGLGSRIGTLLGSAAGLASGLVLGVVLLYYLLKDGSEITRKIVTSRGSGDTAQNERIVTQAAASIRGYFRAKSVLAAAQGLFTAVVLAVMGVPLPAAIGIVNFIGAYIPFLGAFIGGAFAVLMALSEGGIGLAFGALGVVLAANLILENVLEPRLLGSSLKLHPIVVLLATVGGGVVAGIVGLILAAPLTAIGLNLFRELRDSGYFRDDEPHHTPPPDG